MSPGLLLDTYAVLRIIEGDQIGPDTKLEIDRAARDRNVAVSPISAWEIATLASKGRVALSMEPKLWFKAMLDLPGIRLAAMPPETLMDSAFLPGRPPADQADRIIIATARAENLTVLTRDAEILAYSDAGHVRAARC